MKTTKATKNTRENQLEDGQQKAGVKNVKTVTPDNDNGKPGAPVKKGQFK